VGVGCNGFRSKACASAAHVTWALASDSGAVLRVHVEFGTEQQIAIRGQYWRQYFHHSP